MLIMANDLFIIQATLAKEKQSKIEHKPLLKLPTKIQNRKITSMSTYNFLSNGLLGEQWFEILNFFSLGVII